MNEKQRYRKYIKENLTAIILFSVISCIISFLVVAFAYFTKLLIDNAGDGNKFLIFAIFNIGVITSYNKVYYFPYFSIENTKNV